MGYSNAYNAYQKTNINTASQGRLVVLLYEGIIKQLTAAGTYIDDNGKIKPENIEKYGICVQKAQAIITELQVSLDMEKAVILHAILCHFMYSLTKNYLPQI